MPALIASLAMIAGAIAWAIRRARRPKDEGAARFTPSEESSGG